MTRAADLISVSLQRTRIRSEAPPIAVDSGDVIDQKGPFGKPGRAQARAGENPTETPQTFGITEIYGA